MKKDAPKVGEKIEAAVEELEIEAKKVGRKVGGEVKEIATEIKDGTFPWLKLAVVGLVALVAFRIYRAEAAKN